MYYELIKDKIRLDIKATAIRELGAMQAAILTYVYSKCKKYEENGFSVGNCIECCSEELKQILGLPYKRQYNAINKLVASGAVSVEHKNGPTGARFIAINYDKAQKYVI